MLDVIYGQASEPGRVWPRNADSAAAFLPRSRQEVQSRGWMFAVADGRGGTEFGKLASARAVERMVQGFAQAAEDAPLATLMPQLIQSANAAVYDETLNPARLGRRLASTIVSCALRDNHALISHVGNSRCYLVRDKAATLLTQDHTWASEQRRSGAMTAVQAERSEQRHILTRTLGSELVVTPDTTTFPLLPNDILLLCTDGLYEAMYPEDIALIASPHKDPALVARELLAYAIRADGSDNATAQVIQVRAMVAR